MSRRLAILTAQLQNRPLWETVPGNPLVQRNRETGMLRAVGLTIPEKEAEKQIIIRKTPTEELATNNGWFSITPEEREQNRYNKKVQIQVLRKDLLKWVDCFPDGYLNPTGSYRMREI